MFSIVTRAPRWLIRVATFLFLAASLFYLIALPMWTASDPDAFGAFGVGFAAFLLGQTFLLLIELAYSAAAEFYGLRSKHLLPSLLARHPVRRSSLGGQRSAVTLMFVSFALLNYAFAVMYVFISNVVDQAFSGGSLSIFNGLYFSVLTGVGGSFGDILPQHWIARLSVMAHVLVSLFYIVLLFSVSSSHLRERRTVVIGTRDTYTAD